MILIVDDDRAIRLSITLMLKQAQLESHAVSTEAEALEAVRAGDVDLAIIDMNLTPSSTGRDGIEMIRKIRILAPEVPLIMLSAWATVPLAVEGMGYGAVDFVTKPWANRDFMARVRKALGDADRKRQSAHAVATLDDIERQTIEKAIREADGNLSVAAQMLGITRQSLYRRIEKFGIRT